MATRTTYYNLIKPSQTDPVDVRDLNTNFDNIDAIMHTNEVNIDALDGRITTAESDIEDLQEATEHLSDGDTVYPYASAIEIEDALGVNAKDVKVKITAVQSGSGTPSPQNVRPISGWDECEIEVTDGEETTKTYTIDLGGTIYGGTIDVTNGVMPVTHGIVDLGTLNWDIVTSGTYNRFVSEGIKDLIKPPETSQSLGDYICSDYPQITFSEAYSTTKDKAFAVTNAQSGARGNVNIVDSSYNSANDFKTAMSGVQLVYELATPITIQLTPQQIQLLDGYNLISANTGDISITTTDIKGAIGQADALIEANTQAIREIDSLNDSIFGTIENGTTASKTYAQGDYFVKDKKMCKALTSIAQGATFTLGTNYAQYTLADILKAIENL